MMKQIKSRAKHTSTRQLFHALETKAPVSYRAEACRLADDSGLAMTVFATTDPDMPFIVLDAGRGQGFGRAPVSAPYTFLPLVSFMPAKWIQAA